MRVTPILNKSDRPETHRAGWIVMDAEHQIRGGYITIVNDTIVDVGKWQNRPEGGVTDHGPGMIFPSLINCHTHLELGALKDKISTEINFKSWVKDLLYIRENTSISELRLGYIAGLQELVGTGCFVAGDISTLGCFEEEFNNSDIDGIFFNEYLGGVTNSPDKSLSGNDLRKSFAAHAPHTTSPALLKYLKKDCLGFGKPFSIHLAESEEEETFITTGRGEWADFLTQRGIDFTDWPVNAEGSVSYLDSLGILDNQTIAVHVLRAGKNDFSILKKHDVNVCLCPRSNQALHGALPDAISMYKEGIALCLGTDSLASTPSLSIIDEICTMLTCFQGIPPEVIFNMATLNGAKALGLTNRYGTIEKGKAGRCFYLPVEALKAHDVYTGFMRYDNEK